MPFISIQDFKRGVISNADPIDIPDDALQVMENLISRGGFVEKTFAYGQLPLVDSISPAANQTIHGFVYFVSEKYTTDTIGYRLFAVIRELVTDGYKLVLKYWDETSDLWLGLGLTGLYYGKDQLPPILMDKDIMRIYPGAIDTTGIGDDPVCIGLWYGWIERKLFDGLYLPTPAFYEYSTFINTPALSITTEEKDGGIFLAGENYRYKFSAVFDGNQEALFSNKIIDIEIVGADKLIELTFSIIPTEWNKRVTAINVYRTDDITGGASRSIYKLIESINLIRKEPFKFGIGSVDDTAALPTEQFSLGDYNRDLPTYDDLDELANMQVAFSNREKGDIDASIALLGRIDVQPEFEVAVLNTEYKIFSGNAPSYFISKNLLEKIEGTWNREFWFRPNLGSPFTDWIVEPASAANLTISPVRPLLTPSTTVILNKIQMVSDNLAGPVLRKIQLLQAGILENGKDYKFIYDIEIIALNSSLPPELSSSGTGIKIGDLNTSTSTENELAFTAPESGGIEISVHQDDTINLAFLKIQDQDIDTDEITIVMADDGIIGAEQHPLDGSPSIHTNFDLLEVVENRLLVGDVILDPEDVSETRRNGVVYSELSQYDVLPVGNFQQFIDREGGPIQAVQSIFQGAAILMNSAAFLWGVSSAISPAGWPISESLSNLGCLARRGVITVGNTVYSPHHEGIYQLQANKLAESDSTPSDLLLITEAIGDVYRALSLSEKKSILSGYDQQENEIHFLLGSEVWVYSIISNSWRVTSTSSLTGLDQYTSDDNGDLIAVDLTRPAKLLYSVVLDGGTSARLVTKTGVVSLMRPERVNEIIIRYLSEQSLTVKLYAQSEYTALTGIPDTGLNLIIAANGGGADFTNIGAVDNNVGTSFVNSGLIPTSWGDGILLSESPSSEFVMLSSPKIKAHRQQVGFQAKTIYLEIIGASGTQDVKIYSIEVA